MPDWTLTLTGATELTRKLLQELPAALTQEVLRAALTKAAEPMADRMRALAPRGPEAPHLADSIAIAPQKGDEQEAAVLVGPTKDFYYGRFIEHGTKFQPARPFMRPAFDAESATALAILDRELWAAISRAASAGGTGTL